MDVCEGSCQTPGRSLRRAVEDDAAADEHEPLDDVLDGAELVRDVEDRDAELAVELARAAPPSASCASASTPVGRLVEDEQRRLAGERLGDERALLLAARERARAARRPGRRARRARSPPRRSPASRRRSGPSRPPAASRPAETTSRTVAGASIPSVRALREVAERRAAREAVRRLAEEQHRARRRPLEPEHEPQQRRLAAAVRAGDRDELALLDREVDVREHALRPRRRTRRRSSSTASGIRAPSAARRGSPA